MKTNTNNKPVAIWIDDSMFHERDRDLYEWQLKEAEEEAENKFEFHYFESDDDAIPFVIDNAQRIFLFIQDSFRRPGSIIPAWKKLRERPGPSLGLRAGDFYTYVIDSFSPQSGNVFAGYEKEIMLIEVKHFAAHRPVGVGIVRSLYGVKALNKASRAILVTSSYVSEYAKSEFSRVIPWELDFVERKTLIDWCRSYVSELLMDDNFTEQANPADAKKPRR